MSFKYFIILLLVFDSLSLNQKDKYEDYIYPPKLKNKTIQVNNVVDNVFFNKDLIEINKVEYIYCPNASNTKDIILKNGILKGFCPPNYLECSNLCAPEMFEISPRNTICCVYSSLSMKLSWFIYGLKFFIFVTFILFIKFILLYFIFSSFFICFTKYFV
jgi:hypothetical protein